MSNDIKAKVQTQLSWAMMNSHHNGLIARASRTLLTCTTMNEVMGVVTRTLDELGLSGGGRLLIGSDYLNFQFGGGLSMTHCTGLSCLVEPDEQIFTDQNALVFNEQNVLLIVTFNLETSTSKDLLRENLAVFVDIVQAWLIRQQNVNDSERFQRSQRIDIVMRMSKMIDCLSKLSQHLIQSHYHAVESLSSELLSKFPSLALDSDQEECIIDITSEAMEKQKGLLESQLTQNEDLKSIMTEAINALMVMDTQTECEANGLNFAETI